MPEGVFKFAHRPNPDETIDSICPRCFQTVAHVKYEAELPRHEQKHVCDQHILERFGRGIGELDKNTGR